MGFGSFAAHIFEHSLFHVLQGHVDVSGHFRQAGDGGNEFIRPVGGVGVEQTDPEVALHGGEGFEEVDEIFASGGGDLSSRTAAFRPPIHPEVGGVLGNQQQFLDSFRDELLGLAANRFDGATPMFPAHLGDDAEGAGVVATLRDFHIGEVLWGEAPAGGVKIGNVNGEVIGDEVLGGCAGGAGEDATNDGGDLLQLVEADEGVDFLKFAGEFRGKTLGHAAGDDEALIGVATMKSAIAMGLENGGDTFSFGGVDKRAGVDDQDIGLSRVGGEVHSSGAQMTQHDFGVDEIFRAT